MTGWNIPKKNIFSFGKKAKRTLGIRDKQILYHRAKGKCEACGRKIDFSEMHSGHKHAASKGGKATINNSVCVCARCNKLQGTDSWATFMRKMGKSTTRSVTSSTIKHTKEPKTQLVTAYDYLGRTVRVPKNQTYTTTNMFGKKIRMLK